MTWSTNVSTETLASRSSRRADTPLGTIVLCCLSQVVHAAPCLSRGSSGNTVSVLSILRSPSRSTGRGVSLYHEKAKPYQLIGLALGVIGIAFLSLEELRTRRYSVD